MVWSHLYSEKGSEGTVARLADPEYLDQLHVLVDSAYIATGAGKSHRYVTGAIARTSLLSRQPRPVLFVTTRRKTAECNVEAHLALPARSTQAPILLWFTHSHALIPSG